MVNCGRAILVRERAPMVLLVLLIGGFFLLRLDLAGLHGNAGASRPVNVQAEFGRLPLAFEPNQGQTDARVKFQAHGNGYGLYLTQAEAVLVLTGRQKNKADALSMRLIGASQSARLTGVSQLPGHSNYLIGNDPSRWHRNIPQFSRVRYRDVYPGIDLDFYGKQGRLEYDFEVKPGASFRDIELKLNGAQALKVAENGDLVVGIDGRELRFEAPHIYQPSSSGNQPITGNFVLRGQDEVGFDVVAYDRSRALVIDPVLSFSTYLGGAGNASCTAITGATAGFVPHCPAIAVDSAQRAYIAGATDNRTGFPAAASGTPASIGPGGAADVFVARINSSGTQLDFISFLGGSGLDFPTGVGVDSGFNVYVAGTTSSADFPTTPTAFQATATGTHVFLTKLDATGSINEYSTYLAGSGSDTASDLAVDSQGLAYVFGTTTSPNFPVTPGALQSTAKATNQFFVTKLDPGMSASNSVPYSTFIGGSSPANGVVMGGSIAVDSTFNVYLAGGTNFTDMPVVNAFQGTEQGGLDVWVARLIAPGNNTQQYTPNFETYFGGSGDDVGYGVSTDGTNTYVTGSTTSNITIPSGTTAFQAAIGGGTDAFVAKFGVPAAATTGTTQGTVPLSYFTYLGGSATDVGLAIVADPTKIAPGNAHVTGFTDSSNFPVTANPLQSGFGGGRDAFVARILTTTVTGTTNTSSASFLGGAANDIGTSIAEDTALNAYVTGETFSANFPTAAAPGLTPLQAAFSGTSDAFVSKVGPTINGLLSFTCNSTVAISGAGCPTPVPANPTVNPTPVGVGNTITFVYSIYNQGDPVTGALFTDTVQGGANSSTITSVNPGVTGGTTGAGVCSISSDKLTAVCNLGTINTSNTTSTTSGGKTTSTTAAAAMVTVQVTAATPSSTGIIPPKPPDVGNSATLSLPGTAFTPQTASGTASVNDFGVTAAAISPPGGIVTAGATAPYQVTVTPTGPFPEAVSLACGSGLPAGATCSFSNSSIQNLNTGARSVTLDIATTVRVITPASLFSYSGPIYALWLPLSGLALIGGASSRKRRVLLAMVFAVLLSGVVLQSACGYSNRNTSTTTGTPAGTYSITVNATSGGATRSTLVQLVVK